MTGETYQALSDNYLEGFKSRYLPSILAMLLSEDEARLLEKLPATADEVARLAGLDVETVSEIFQRLHETGLIQKESSAGTVQYTLDKDILDSLLQDRRVRSRLKTGQDMNTFLDLFKDLFEKELQNDEKWSNIVIPQTRTIPVERTISMKWGEVIPQESVCAILESARVIAQAECTCRIMERNCDNPTDVCIVLNDFAENFIERGAAKRISKERALEILAKTEDLGLVHQLNNTDSDGYEFICNCCSCCCMVLRAMMILGKENVCYQSRYLARVDHDKCDACGLCVDRCQFGAMAIHEDYAEADKASCFGCGLCASGCPNEAIEMVCVREPEHVTGNLQDTS